MEDAWESIDKEKLTEYLGREECGKKEVEE